MKIEINAQKREGQGSGASRRLRRSGNVPGIVYGAGQEAESIQLDHNELFQALRKEAFHSSVLTINVGGAKQQALLRDVQWHAYRPHVLHVDFQRVDPNQKLHTKVPLHFINGDIAPGVKLSSGVVSHVMNELEVSCLPKDLPEFIEVDLKDLQAGHSLHLKEVKLPAGVEAVLHGDDPVLASIVVPRGAVSAAEGAEGEAKA